MDCVANLPLRVLRAAAAPIYKCGFLGTDGITRTRRGGRVGLHHRVLPDFETHAPSRTSRTNRRLALPLPGEHLPDDLHHHHLPRGRLVLVRPQHLLPHFVKHLPRDI
jgi:hypothetical protein